MAHAQIDEYYITHFHLLTRNEIIVFAYLLKKRNGKSKQCNPKLSTIAAEINLSLPRVSESVKGLEAKNWIIWESSGDFVICEKVNEEATTQVTNCVRKSYAMRNTELRNAEVEVTQSVTLLNKDIEQTNEQTKERTSDDVPKKRHRLPVDFEITSEMRGWAAATVPTVDLEIENIKFFKYWTEKNGNGALKANWKRTWENWILTAASRYPKTKITPEIAELFTYIASFEDRKTVVNETEWLKLVQKLQTEGMTVFGIKSLHRYCREVANLKTITPKVMDWKFTEYRAFVKSQQARKQTAPSAPFNPNAVVIENSPMPAGY